MRATIRGKVTLGGVLVGLAVLALTSGPLLAQTEPPAADATPTADQMDMMGDATPVAGGMPMVGEMHELMHQMMDTMHGPGTSDRMHEAMGTEGEQMMEQCAAMMGMMGMMMGMMGGQGMEGMEGMQGMDGTPMPMATPGS
ncbi:MAG: hypothetical protein ACRDJW_10925 [Thermomicrobiales bacterium]